MEQTEEISKSSDEMLANVDRAVKSGKYIIACFHVEDDKVHLHRHMSCFPSGDLAAAVQLLANDLLKAKE